MKGKYLHALSIGAGVAIVMLTLLSFGLFDRWQMQLSDTLFVPEAPNPNIVIIAIDDASIQKIGRWPWDRSVHANLLDILDNYPAAIGLDVSFPEISTQEHDVALARSLGQRKGIVIPIEANTIVSQQEGVIIKNYLFPISQFSMVTDAGLVNMVTDSDGITRQSPMVVKTDGGLSVENFSVKILESYYNFHNIQFNKNIPTENGLLRIHFSDKPNTYPMYSYVDVLKGIVRPEIFEGKIVLIGSTALDLHDNLLTPVSGGVAMSGIELHANVMHTLMDRKFISMETPVITMLSITVVALASSLLFVHFGIIGGVISLIGLVAVYTVFAILSFDAGTIRNLVFPPFSIFIVYISIVLYKYFIENKQKRFIRKALSYYVSESVLKEVLGNPKKLSLGGERKEITVLFSDIAGFTTISERIDPETLAKLLNQYLTQMTNLVFSEMGVLDKYIGDAVMAFWGAPLTQKEHALLACKTALRMQEEITRIRQDWKKIDIDNFDVRIGINTGDMVVGNMGSDLRFDYTLLGDNVNLGSRLEGINKEYGTSIIISQSTQDQVKDQVIARRLDTVAVKGKARGVTIYELRGLGVPTEEEQGFLNTFESSRKLYAEGKFKHALVAFEDMAKHFLHDIPTKVYILRCKNLVKHPPKDWDGVYHAKSK